MNGLLAVNKNKVKGNMSCAEHVYFIWRKNSTQFDLKAQFWQQPLFVQMNFVCSKAKFLLRSFQTIYPLIYFFRANLFENGNMDGNQNHEL